MSVTNQMSESDFGSVGILVAVSLVSFSSLVSVYFFFSIGCTVDPFILSNQIMYVAVHPLFFVSGFYDPIGTLKHQH